MKIRHSLLILALAAVCGTSGGCGAGDGKDSAAKPPEKTAKITQQQAEAIAKSEVVRRGWKEWIIQHARLEGDVWMISLERIPAEPGGHAVVKVSDYGKVVDYIPGA